MPRRQSEAMSYATLNQQEIVATIARLHRRISERFPDANLARVAADLVEVGDQHAANVQRVSVSTQDSSVTRSATIPTREVTAAREVVAVPCAHMLHSGVHTHCDMHAYRGECCLPHHTVPY